ncbi:myo-inositol 2-dehydrogenase [Saccharopolyspora erythraea NRRL 2338]|uniref:Inositol 2-dehydrogenase 3 n=2 Tax=Saccharopolyspora erythraea TaxID=1836 RepID=IOLG3_SACEN|nr:Gfo/Idh/MocA family oxidoreductase [Saccharopolyspora erythraea]A4FIQ1.1 RecName: Full=Inositol 2-dehydrogenase 3; AltName: Full=Myo-inositol 2-dehydrogenase 3; Short=MI 2-dehydrogenase 3 [Saccharopolyspora erythraea NRRL 2338]EQD85869.1 inositol 2-dehydrogenase [Saccharopolyspora erythraea D]PFG97601.1 myo-inositol 2-dehydrogenase [Saccharopolyspora erythraea NRRL 2338]QRK87763.1 Gfo/Idh/MocA family oxidoreductase [Saccharopolyspora erythraea]CAM03926.1 myo-inositol 2-dehydrogenase [Saccha
MTVRVGVIGTGMIGQDHIRRLTRVVTGAEIVAVTDIDADRAASVAGGVGARTMPSGADVIGSADVDAVLVTSWGPTHAEHVLAAIEAGKAVFCEKPLATEVEDCLRIVEAESARGKRLVQVGFMRRYDAGYREMKELVDAGGIGTPLMAHCVHRNPTVPETYHSAMAAQDTAVHEIDTLRWLLDDEIVSAQVIRPRRTSKRFEHLQDPQIMLFETESGARIDVEVFVNCQYGYDIQCEVVGESGTVRLPDPARTGLPSAGSVRAAITQDWKQRFADAFDAELQSWVDSVAHGAAGGPSAWDGYAATAICGATVEALHSGQVVPVALKDRPGLYGGNNQ